MIPEGRGRFIALMTLDTKNINFVIVSNISYGHCWIDHPRVDNMKVWHVFFSPLHSPCKCVMVMMFDADMTNCLRSCKLLPNNA